MKPLTLPPCGSCDLAIPDGVNLFCHGAPPSCWTGPKIELIDNVPQTVTATFASYPPVRRDMTGCAMHPLMRKKIGRGQ